MQPESKWSTACSVGTPNSTYLCIMIASSRWCKQSEVRYGIKPDQLWLESWHSYTPCSAGWSCHHHYEINWATQSQHADDQGCRRLQPSSPCWGEVEWIVRLRPSELIPAFQQKCILRVKPTAQFSLRRQPRRHDATMSYIWSFIKVFSCHERSQWLCMHHWVSCLLLLGSLSLQLCHSK